MTDAIKCGRLEMVFEDGRYVGHTTGLTLIIEPAHNDIDFWIWKCLPLGNGQWAFGTPEHAAENMRSFLVGHFKELEAIL